MMLHKNECCKNKKHKKHGHQHCGHKNKKHKKHDVWYKKQGTVLAILLAVLLTGGLALAAYFAWKNLEIFVDEIE